MTTTLLVVRNTSPHYYLQQIPSPRHHLTGSADADRSSTDIDEEICEEDSLTASTKIKISNSGNQKLIVSTSKLQRSIGSNGLLTCAARTVIAELINEGSLVAMSTSRNTCLNTSPQYHLLEVVPQQQHNCAQSCYQQIYTSQKQEERLLSSQKQHELGEEQNQERLTQNTFFHQRRKDSGSSNNSLNIISSSNSFNSSAINSFRCRSRPKVVATVSCC